MEQYELKIESLTESGRTNEVYTIDARSETEATIIAKPYRTPYNNVMVTRL